MTSTASARQQGPRHPSSRLLGLLVALAVLTSACLPEAPAAPEPTLTAVPGVAEIRLARQMLGPPTVEMARAVVALVAALDRVRHDTPRGEGHPAAIDELAGFAATVEQASEALDAALAALPLAPADAPATADALERVTVIGAEMIAAGQQVLAVRQPVEDGLRAAAALDLRMDAVVEAWAFRATRPEIEAHLGEVLPEAEALVEEALRLPVWPTSCTTMRANRVRWAELLSARTAELRELVAAREGAAYDDARDRYRLAPYAEDRAIADSVDRACWDEHAGVAAAVRDVEAAVEDVEAALG